MKNKGDVFIELKFHFIKTEISFLYSENGNIEVKLKSATTHVIIGWSMQVETISLDSDNLPNRT